VQDENWFLSFAVSFFIFLYVFCAVGLQGIPGISRSALICAVCLWCFLLEGIRRHQIVLEKWIWFPAVFFLYCMISALRTQDMTVELIGKLVTVWGGSIGVGIALRNGVKWAVPIYALICAAVVSVVAHWLGINSIIIWSQEDMSISYERASGLMGNPNMLAMACGFPAYFVFLMKGRLNFLISIFCLGLAVYGTILTGSRKGIILVTCLFVYIGLHKILSGNRTTYIGLCALTIAILLIMFSEEILDILLSGTEGLLAIKRMVMAFHGEGGSFSERMEMIQISEKLFWQRPFFGYGLGMFGQVSGFGRYSHNNYCELAIGGGIFGIILFYTVHFNVLRYSIYMSREKCVCIWILLMNVLLQDVVVVSYLDRLIVLILIMSLVFCMPTSLWYEKSPPVMKDNHFIWNS
jgi:hypothetical protein